MGSRLRSIAAWGLAVAALAATSPEQSVSPLPPIVELVSGERYVADVSAGRAELDLPLDGSSRYLVVLGSLASFGPPHDVVLTATSCDNPRPLRIRPFARTPRSVADAASVGGVDRAATGRHRASEPASHAQAVSRPGVADLPTRTFHLHVTDGNLNDPRQYARVVGREIAVGRSVRVLLDEKHPHGPVTRNLAEEVVRLCDEDVGPAISRSIGPIADIDRDGRLTILLTPWLGALQGGRTSLGGFVRSADFDASVPSPLSNRGDILYLNATQTPGPHLRTLILHELTHAACISARLPTQKRPAGLPHEEDWISEGTAHLMEVAHGGGWSNLDYRIAEFLDDPSRYPLVVPDYYRAGLWRSHGCRGANFLFLQWCAGQAGGDFPRQLTQSADVGVRSVERIVGRPFNELFREWSLALLCLDGEPEIVIQHAATKSPRATAINLTGRLGRHDLHGPRREPWPIDREPARKVSLATTTVAFVEMDTAQSGTRRIRIEAPVTCRLQVTLIRIPGSTSDSAAPQLAHR